MVVDLNPENILDRLLDRLDAWVAELDDFARIGHDDVVVLLVEIRFLIMRLVLAELVFADERAVEQEFDRVVQRRTAHAVVLVFHLDVEVLDIKMFLAVVNFLQDRKALGRFTVSVFLKIHRKNALYNFLIFTVVGGN